MPRHKSYVREEVIEKACYAFWKHGYRALGIRAIEEIVGLGRFAIRTEFNGKEGLFLEALKTYRERGRQFVIAPIDNGQDVAALQGLLTNTVTPYEGGYGQFGCFFVNTIVENGALDIEAFREQTDGHFNDVRSATKRLIEREQAKGTVRTEVSGEEAGEFMAGTLMAIGLISRNANDVTAAKRYVDVANATIESWCAAWDPLTPAPLH